MDLESIQTYLVLPEQLEATLNSSPLERWLTENECSRLRSLRSLARRTDWLAGRLAAKQLLRDHLSQTQHILLKLNEIEIYNNASDVPELTSITQNFQ